MFTFPTIPMPSGLEIAAIVFTTVCIFLAGRNNIHTWWTGLVGCVLYGLVFYNAKLYADSMLQVVFFATGIFGWWAWIYRSRDIETRPMKSLSSWNYVAIVGFASLGTVTYGDVLHAYTDAYAPFVDSFVLFSSLVAQGLLMARYVQTWPAWLIVNIVSVPLFWSRELYLSSILYAFYLVHSGWSWYYWARLTKKMKVA